MSRAADLRALYGRWPSWRAVAGATDTTIFEEKLYARRDGGILCGAQIRARAAKLPDIFEGSQDGSNRIRLRAA
jgi:hypothetical protein